MKKLFHGSLIGALHRRLAQVAMNEAAEWWFWGDPDWYRFNASIARRHLRMAWKWEAR